MDNLTAARLQMATTLGFHIVFACIGMTMPWLMASAQWRYLKTREAVYHELAQAWAKGVAVFFAVGAVSGTVLSLELGFLWPSFMRHAGPIIGLPFSWEGTAFFLEAVALGLFLYGRQRMPERVHFAIGVLVGVCGVASGILVVSANAWMNSPAGFRWVDGQAVDVDPVAAMFNDAWASQALHMTLAAFVATSFAVAGVHAYRLLVHPGHPLHTRALPIAMAFASVSALLQLVSGDFSAKDVARRQPIKLAAMEALYETQRRAPLLIGGIPDDRSHEVHFGVEIPAGLSVLAFADPDAEVRGLESFPEDVRPPTMIVHLAFQMMVAVGTALAAMALVYAYLRRKRRTEGLPVWFLRVLALATPLGFLAVEAGWTVTEVGRQPFVVYGIMRTKDAVSPMPGLIWPLLMSLVVYAVLVAVVTAILIRLVHTLEAKVPTGAAHG